MHNPRKALSKGSPSYAFVVSLGALFFAFVISALPIALSGNSPLAAYYHILVGAAGSVSRLGVSLTRATPMLFTGLAVAIAFRSGVFNIGAEGQLYVGALGATFLALQLDGLPRMVLLPASLIVGFVCGAMWGVIPGYLKARFGKNEIIVTIMLNFVAFWSVSYLVHGPLREPGSMYSYTAAVPEQARLTVLLRGTQLSTGFVLGVCLIVVAHILFKYTILGFRLHASGTNPNAAHYAGIPVKSDLVKVMAFSGGLAGLAGAIEVLGNQYRLSNFFAIGLGYDGIAVALLGNSQPIGVLFAALFIGLLRSGATIMQRRIGVPAALALIVQGLAVFFVVIGLRVRPGKSKAKRTIPVHRPLSETQETQSALSSTNGI